MPTLASFLKVKIEDKIAKEIDGISLLDTISITHPSINIFQNKLDVSWQTVNKEGNVSIWLSATNAYKNGASDNYVLLKTVAATMQHATIDIKNYPSDFYKVVIQGKYNQTNKWFVK